ncbi:MAG: hypothetical protein Q9164_001874 [Protoblastenia rupestris]
MAMRGQRFTVDLDDCENTKSTSIPTVGFGLVGDIKERAIASSPKPPSPPRIKGSATGFPTHKDRLRSPRFKQNNQKVSSNTKAPYNQNTPKSKNDKGLVGQNGQQNKLVDAGIDAENKQRLAEMSEIEIAATREQLMSSLSPSIIEKLLKKANIDDPSTSFIDSPEPVEIPTTPDKKSPTKKVAFEDPDATSASSSPALHPVNPASEDLPPLHPPSDLQPVASKQPLPPLPDIHFPKAPAPPDLDPDDPNFLSNLHSTYFPSLPSDPSALAWMQPINPEEQASYSPSQKALPPSSLRFDFRGHLLPPRLSSQMPSTKGLHHHGHAPESAGYTIPELAHLARSAVTSQRCIAYQTLGRILYRLGRGDFGSEGEDLCEGLWELIEKGKVLEGMVDAASRDGEGNRSVWAIATDAVWLWRKGGGRRWKGR